MGKKVNYQIFGEKSFEFLDGYLQGKEDFSYQDLYEEWVKVDNINEEDDWLDFAFLFKGKSRASKLEKIFRFLLVDYALEKEILLLSFDKKIEEVDIFRNVGDVGLYNFLKKGFNGTSEKKNLINGTQKVATEIRDKKILEILINFYEPTDKFKDKFFPNYIKNNGSNDNYQIAFEILRIDEEDENKNLEFLNLNLPQMKMINKVKEEIKRKGNQLEIIENDIKEKEKELKRVSTEVDKLNRKLKKFNKQIENSKNSVITILGTFVSIFTVVSINTQFFKEAVSNRTGAGILILLLGINIITLASIFGLLYSIKKLFYEIEEKDKKEIKLSLTLALAVIFILLVFIIWKIDNFANYNIYLSM